MNAVADPDRATAFTAGVVRRGDATIAVSTSGRAPALAGLLREAIEAVLPQDAAGWVDLTESERPAWKEAPAGDPRHRGGRRDAARLPRRAIPADAHA